MMIEFVMHLMTWKPLMNMAFLMAKTKYIEA
jgi:hypothetical protein